MDLIALNAGTLDGISARVPVPSYDRSQVRVGIVHLGVGGFHRAHQAMYVDRLMNAGLALDWGICGVGVLPQDRGMQQALDSQDGSIVKYLLAPEDPEAVIEQLAAQSTRIVSLTVTEGGYNVHPVTGEFDVTNEQVLAEVQSGAGARSTFGLVTEALLRRRDRGLAPFTVMSCDNIQGNGDVARKMFTAFATLRSEDLGQWMSSEVRFPNSMVDRITPVTADSDRAMLAERFGIEDAWPVVCEPFTQWVLEDEFSLGRPPYEDAGVQIVHNVVPYELMKLRLLNASHQALCYLGYLSGYRYAHEVCQDPLFVDFLIGYMHDEATPTLEPVPGVDLAIYRATLIERFANPEVRDTLARLCAESSDRIPKWVLPVIREQLAAGGQISHATLVVAAWARYAEAVDEQGEPITVVDRLSAHLRAAAVAQRTDPIAFVAQRDLFGDLVDNERFVTAYTAALASLHAHGALATVTDLVR
jgi:mannitol 2-dehydrogenase